MDQYHYLPLQAGQIRLLTLAPGTLSERLHVEIQHVELHEHGDLPGPQTPFFEALSYTWGDPTATEELATQDEYGSTGRILIVTRNLASALQRLRFTNRPRILWVDAVCIDQSNVRERNEQVRQMVKIYSLSERVLIYIGEGNEDTDAAMDIIADISGAVTKSSWMLVDRLLDRPWFGRVWVIQEVARSKTAIVICGSRVVSWYCLTRWPMRQASLQRSDVLGSDVLPGVLNYTSGFASSTGTEALLRMLRETRASSATDARDKVFALLGLLSDEERHVYERLVDYSVPVDLIYVRTALSIIQESKSLRVLSAVQPPLFPMQPSALVDLPSWVPNWSCPTHVVPLGLGQDSVEPYDAGGRSCIMRNDVAYNLVLRGVRVAKVQRIGKGPELHSPEHRHPEVVLKGGYDILETESVFPLESFLHVISATPPSAIQSDTGYSRDVISLEELQDLMDEVGPTTVSRLQHRVTHLTYGRRIFRAGDDFLGLGPERLEEGDIVVVLPGGPTPYILRPSSVNQERYELIGECYVYGLMSCEALQHVQEELQKRGSVVPVTGHARCSSPLEWFTMDTGPSTAVMDTTVNLARTTETTSAGITKNVSYNIQEK